MKCQRKVSDHTGYYWFPCKNDARYAVDLGNPSPKAMCGIHARRYLKAHPENVKPLLRDAVNVDASRKSEGA